MKAIGTNGREKSMQRPQQPQTLINMSLPDFKDGYEAGRNSYFQSNLMLTDTELLAELRSIFANPNDVDLEWEIGTLIGQLSGPVIPQTEQDHPGKDEDSHV
jgi:hypothetical protein